MFQRRDIRLIAPVQCADVRFIRLRRRHRRAAIVIGGNGAVELLSGQAVDQDVMNDNDQVIALRSQLNQVEAAQRPFPEIERRVD